MIDLREVFNLSEICLYQSEYGFSLYSPDSGSHVRKMYIRQSVVRLPMK